MSEGRYRALLCLVQVAVDDPDGRRRAADPPDRRARPTSTPRRWPQLLADPEIEIVLHAGRQDVAILRRAWQTELNNIFDTQIAAGLRRRQRPGRLRQPARRDARPAGRQDRQLHALGRAAADRRAAQLRRRGRRAPARARRRAPAAADARAGGSSGRARSAAGSSRPPTSATPRPPGSACPASASSTPRSRAVARELAAWRERTASREDRPVGSIARRPGAGRAGQAPARRTSAGSSRSAASTRRRSSAGARRSSTAIARGREAPPIPRDEARGALGARRRAADRAGRGAAARARARGRARLRADRVARRARADRRRRPPRRARARRAHARPAGAASSSAPICATCSPAAARSSVGPDRRLELEPPS